MPILPILSFSWGSVNLHVCQVTRCGFEVLLLDARYSICPSTVFSEQSLAQSQPFRVSPAATALRTAPIPASESACRFKLRWAMRWSIKIGHARATRAMVDRCRYPKVGIQIQLLTHLTFGLCNKRLLSKRHWSACLAWRLWSWGTLCEFIINSWVMAQAWQWSTGPLALQIPRFAATDAAAYLVPTSPPVWQKWFHKWIYLPVPIPVLHPKSFNQKQIGLVTSNGLRCHSLSCA